MNSKPVFALREVEADVEDAVAHYESWRSDGKAHVLNLYEETIRWIEWNPDRFPKKFGRVRSNAPLGGSRSPVSFAWKGMTQMLRVVGREVIVSP